MMDTQRSSHNVLFSEENNCLTPIKMVEEVSPQNRELFAADADCYTVYAVTSGKGLFRTSSGEFSVQEGDVFVAFLGVPYCYSGQTEDFRFVALSFQGAGAKALLARVGITAETPFRADQTAIKVLYLQCIERAEQHAHLSDFLATAALWETLVLLGEKIPAAKATLKHGAKQERISAITQYMKQNYNRAALSLEGVAQQFSINPNYLSRLFKEMEGVNFSTYLTAVRVERARFLMESGLSSVKNVAFLVGFGDPLYFSKVFKKECNCTPREYIDRCTAQRARAEQKEEF